MRTVVLAVAIALAAAAPALAKSPKAVQGARVSTQVLNANASVRPADSIAVYANGREIGRDPDANIRQSLQNEYYGLQGH